VEKLCSLRVKVVFGDIQIEAGEKQAQKLSSYHVKFVRTDVTKYNDLINLFGVALKEFGRVDCGNFQCWCCGSWELGRHGIGFGGDQKGTIDILPCQMNISDIL
jgi:hypothetical protein